MKSLKQIFESILEEGFNPYKEDNTIDRDLMHQKYFDHSKYHPSDRSIVDAHKEIMGHIMNAMDTATKHSKLPGLNDEHPHVNLSFVLEKHMEQLTDMQKRHKLDSHFGQHLK